MPRPIVITDFDPRWAAEFERVAGRIRREVGDAALRIDHVGSTAVHGLGAKDVIDVQITVRDLSDAGALVRPLRAAGFRRGEAFARDEFHGLDPLGPELRKLYMREPEGERRVHIHIRERGRFNQRYALLFRDYLRASATARAEYELFKRRAAQVFPDDIDGYLGLKEPVFHILFEAASLWAAQVGWRPDDASL